MRTIEWQGTLTCVSSLAHNGKAAGNSHSFRRETLILPTGRRIDGIPVASGGMLRGGLRRLAAALAKEAIAPDEGRLPFNVVHAMRTGGALRETRAAEEVLTAERQAVIRDLVPMLSVFGFSTAGRIIAGRLDVGKAFPVAQETAHLAPHYGVDLSEYTPSSVWQLLQRETNTRFSDVSTAIDYVDSEEHGREAQENTGTMFWTQETLPAGTRLFHKIVLNEGTPAEVSFMDDLLRVWSTRARIGAHRARGMGAVRGDYERHAFDLTGRLSTDEPGVDWVAQTQERRDEVLEALRWL